MSTEDAGWVLVTGANKGIGLATVAEILRHHPRHGVWLGSRDLARGKAARAALLTTVPNVAERLRVVPLDVSEDASVSNAARTVAAQMDSPLFGVVNNAGIGFPEGEMRAVLQVNTWGAYRVCEAFLPLLDPDGGRVVHVSSAAGPNFVARCDPATQHRLTRPEVTWAEVEAMMFECLDLASRGEDFDAHGWGDGAPYGLSKACLNAYTMALARTHPQLRINACTPGFIETDLTRRYAVQVGRTPADLGLKSPTDGARVVMHLLFGEPGGTGWYFGSDAQRSPIDRYRAPGDPPYREPDD